MFWKKKRTYLDYAAGAGGNVSSPHAEGREAKKMLEDSRTDIARLLEVQSDDVLFTSGATEANALAILGVVRSRQKAVGRDKKIHALYLPSAHASVIENMKLLAEERIIVEALPIKDYRVDTETLAKMLRPETVLVSMDAVCGETGTIWNTREVANLLQTMSGRTTSRHGERPFLHVDASQAPLTEKITRAHFCADMLTLDASKVGPPRLDVFGEAGNVRGIGVLIAHRTIPITPLYRGGGQERGLRSGSEAPELAREFAACLRQAAFNREEFRARAARARANLIEAITSVITNVFVNESRAQAPHILNLSLPGRDTDYLVALLDESGFAISTRSACETYSEEGSRAVLVLTDNIEKAKATLRISWGPNILERELTHFVKALVRAVSFIDNE